jgi:ABC-type polysaccharide/polyol phosphate export permease
MKHAASIATALARAFLMVRHERSFLGVIWYALGPIMMLVVVAALHRSSSLSGAPTLASLAIGLCCFSYFRSVTINISSALRNSIGLLRNVTIPMSSVFGARAIESAVIHGIELILVLVVAFATYAAWYGIFVYIVPFLLFTVIAISVGLVLAILASFADDIRNAWSYLVTIVMFASPVFVEVSRASRPWFMELNPMSSYIDASRAALEFGVFDWRSYIELGLWGIVLSLSAWFLLRRFGPTMIERL